MYIYVGDQHEILNLIGMAIVLTLLTGIRIIFYAVIGGVILSWVSPQNSNPALQLVEEISDKTLSPIRKYIPSAGGLDFSPIFILILVNLLESFYLIFIGLFNEKKSQLISFPDGITLESGYILNSFDLMIESYGELNESKSNAILVCHAFSGNHHVAGEDKELGRMVGPNSWA